MRMFEESLRLQDANKEKLARLRRKLAMERRHLEDLANMGAIARRLYVKGNKKAMTIACEVFELHEKVCQRADKLTMLLELRGREREDTSF